MFNVFTEELKKAKSASASDDKLPTDVKELQGESLYCSKYSTSI